jgi:hypothetical protein
VNRVSGIGDLCQLLGMTGSSSFRRPFVVAKPQETAQIVQRFIDERCLSSCDELQNRREMSYR